MVKTIIEKLFRKVFVKSAFFIDEIKQRNVNSCGRLNTIAYAAQNSQIYLLFGGNLFDYLQEDLLSHIIITVYH